MISYDMAGVADDDTTRQHNDLDAFADETPGYGITVRVEIDGAVRLHFAHEIAQLSKRCTA
jgi:hypothetical protein